MLCQICKVNEATVRYTEIINNSVTEIHVCQKCAQFEDKAVGTETPFPGMLASWIGYPTWGSRRIAEKYK